VKNRIIHEKYTYLFAIQENIIIFVPVKTIAARLKFTQLPGGFNCEKMKEHCS